MCNPRERRLRSRRRSASEAYLHESHDLKEVADGFFLAAAALKCNFCRATLRKAVDRCLSVCLSVTLVYVSKRLYESSNFIYRLIAPSI